MPACRWPATGMPISMRILMQVSSIRIDGNAACEGSQPAPDQRHRLNPTVQGGVVRQAGALQKQLSIPR